MVERSIYLTGELDINPSSPIGKSNLRTAEASAITEVRARAGLAREF